MWPRAELPWNSLPPAHTHTHAQTHSHTPSRAHKHAAVKRTLTALLLAPNAHRFTRKNSEDLFYFCQFSSFDPNITISASSSSHTFLAAPLTSIREKGHARTRDCECICEYARARSPLSKHKPTAGRVFVDNNNNKFVFNLLLQMQNFNTRRRITPIGFALLGRSWSHLSDRRLEEFLLRDWQHCDDVLGDEEMH